MADKQPAHVARMVEERDQLDDRTTKLEAFVGTATYAGLDAEDKALLAQQLTHMQGYRTMLISRLMRAGVDVAEEPAQVGGLVNG